MLDVLFSVTVLSVLIAVLAATILYARHVLMPQKAVAITLNATQSLNTKTGQKLLSALTDNGIMVPSVCAGAGTCGLCKIKINEGVDNTGPVEMSRLSTAEIRDGIHLACQVTLRGPVSVTVPDSLLNAESVECTVISSRFLTPLIREIVLQFPDEAWPDTKAGDYIQLEAPAYELDFATLDVPTQYEETWQTLRGIHAQNEASVTRAYSISNRLEDTKLGQIVLNIRLALPPPSNADAPPGIVSSWLFCLKPGDTVHATGPFGSFRAQDTQKEMIFIGGGVGMAPLRAIIHEQIEVRKTGRKMSLWYGARSRAELFYVDELDALEKKFENFSWVVSLSEPASDDNWDGPTGFIHSVVLEQYLRKHPTPEDCEFYLCGPPLMMKAVRAMLDDLGVEPDSIFFDDFGV